MAAEDDRNENRPAGPEGPMASATAEGQAEGDAHQQELALREQAYAELEGQFKRLAADFENYRRRVTAEREELTKFAASRVFENLLPVVDNFERALDAMGKATEVAQVRSGIEMIHRQLQDFLAKSGVAAMEAQGQKFDPNLHEAIAQMENPDLPDETIMAVAQKGYLYNGKVLRYAMVQVSRNPQHAVSQSNNGQNPAEDAAAIKEEHNG